MYRQKDLNCRLHFWSVGVVPLHENRLLRSVNEACYNKERERGEEERVQGRSSQTSRPRKKEEHQISRSRRFERTQTTFTPSAQVSFGFVLSVGQLQLWFCLCGWSSFFFWIVQALGYFLTVINGFYLQI